MDFPLKRIPTTYVEALQITQQLSILHTGSVVAVEPNLDQKLASIQNIQLMSMREAREVADVHVLLVDHREFKASKIRGPYIIDTRGLVNAMDLLNKKSNGHFS